MNRIIKRITYTFSFIISILILTGTTFFLYDKNYLFFSTGTDKKAFLNSTWLMSENEIERANNTFLKRLDSNDWGILYFEPDVINPYRYKTLKQTNINLWNHEAKVEYGFFDNKLYKYHVEYFVYNHSKHHNILTTSLKERFGDNPITKLDINDKQYDIINRYMWNTSDVDISYIMSHHKKKGKYKVNINATYKPYSKKIESISNKEKKGYF